MQAGTRAAVSGQFPDRDRLPEAQNARLFTELIAVAEFADVVAVDHPGVVFTGGQAGSGKSHAKSLLGEAFGAPGYVDIGTDNLRVYHPRWLELLETDSATATLYTQADAQAWVARSVALAVERRVNVVMDSTLSRESEVTAFLTQFRDHGYRTEIAFVAAPLAMSWVGNLARYQGMLDAQGQGRVSLREPYEHGAAQILTVLARLEQAAPIDRLSVYRRGGTLLYRNDRRADGTWEVPPAAAAVVEQERRRRWSEVEADTFLQDLQDLATRMAPQHRPDLAYAVELAAHAMPTDGHRAALAKMQARFGRSGVTPGAGDTSAARRAAAALQQPPPREGPRRPATGSGPVAGPGAAPGRDDRDLGPGRRR